MNRQLFETYMALDNWHQFRLRLFIEGIFVGIVGGLKDVNGNGLVEIMIIYSGDLCIE